MRIGAGVRTPAEEAGLENHGATCYLNSLMQCLYNMTEYKKEIFRATTSETTPIIKQLQRLFARLALCKRHSIDTFSLLESFGWSKSERTEQHDVHEFYSLLMDATGMESTQLSLEINRLFVGYSYGIAIR